MNDKITEFVKSSYALPVALFFVLVFGILWKSNFNLVDIVANRVIEKMDGEYHPYSLDSGDHK